jgi:hypothetical protein
MITKSKRFESIFPELPNNWDDEPELLRELRATRETEKLTQRLDDLLSNRKQGDDVNLAKIAGDANYAQITDDPFSIFRNDALAPNVLGQGRPLNMELIDELFRQAHMPETFRHRAAITEYVKRLRLKGGDINAF